MTIDDLYKDLPYNSINWDVILNNILLPYKDLLENTNQDPKWHKEGNVLNHTKMVCENLLLLNEYQSLDKDEKLVLFLAALFHDIAKPLCTKLIDNQISSPNHGPIGACVTREYLWKKYNLAGKKELISIREGVCLLIKYHTTPLHIANNTNGIKRLIKLSLNTNLTQYFNLKYLTILSKADVLGRISDDTQEQLNKIKLTIDLAREIDCYEKAFVFSNSFTKYKYFNSNNTWHYDNLYDDTWGEIILMSGLPGVGKDSFIKKYYQNLPMISLDDIRIELKIEPTDEQGLIINEAINRAKDLLRKKQVFIWNATNTTALIRSKIIKMIYEYHARIKIIYLETDYFTNIERNKTRNKAVPNSVIDKLINHMNIPEGYEAHDVNWITF
ncbi:MAG: AAA family ATPase [Anaeroplasma sp.]